MNTSYGAGVRPNTGTAWEVLILCTQVFVSSLQTKKTGVTTPTPGFNVTEDSISYTRSVRLSVRPSAWNNSAPTRRIFMKFYI
jgi:hypothetical protein